jgi:hypothetical protein
VRGGIVMRVVKLPKETYCNNIFITSISYDAEFPGLHISGKNNLKVK